MSRAEVLVIDDEYGLRSGVRQILEMEGYSVTEAECGRTALDQLQRRHFDVALIDYQLPDLDGLTLLQAIKSQGLDTMTCMITAYANIETAIAATRQGIDFFLPKPFTPDDLLGVLETLLRYRGMQQEAERLRRVNEANLLALAGEKSQTRSLVACLRDPVLVANRDGEVALVNPAMARLLGRPEEELLRQSADAVLRGQGLELLAEALGQAQPPANALEVELGERSLAASLSAFHSDEGQELGRILTLADISELRRMALEKARFVRTMVHEFRSPLGAIRSMLEVVLDRSLGEDLAQYQPFLERAQARIDGLVELIGELLSLARLDSQRPQGPAGPSAPGPALRHALDQQRETAAAARVELSCTAPADLPPVAMEADDLASLLGNLVANGVKYNRPDGSVTLSARVEGRSLQIEVRDTGLGISPEALPHLFDEFFREKRRETRDLPGNGLGLAICKRLAERVGGRIEAESELGRGSVFRLHLPLAPA